VVLGVYGVGHIGLKSSVSRDELPMYDLDDKSIILHGLQYSRQLIHSRTAPSHSA
jgi:hypothetical protein